MFRDKRGVEYDAVPLPTHEVTVAVALDARIVRRTAARKTVPVYAVEAGSRGVRPGRISGSYVNGGGPMFPIVSLWPAPATYTPPSP